MMDAVFGLHSGYWGYGAFGSLPGADFTEFTRILSSNGVRHVELMNDLPGAPSSIARSLSFAGVCGTALHVFEDGWNSLRGARESARAAGTYGSGRVIMSADVDSWDSDEELLTSLQSAVRDFEAFGVSASFHPHERELQTGLAARFGELVGRQDCLTLDLYWARCSDMSVDAAVRQLGMYSDYYHVKDVPNMPDALEAQLHEWRRAVGGTEKPLTVVVEREEAHEDPVAFVEGTSRTWARVVGNG